MNAPVPPSSVFAAVEMAPRDPILGITETFVADTTARCAHTLDGRPAARPGRVVERYIGSTHR